MACHNRYIEEPNRLLEPSTSSHFCQYFTVSTIGWFIYL